jgi:uncharacterized protein (DUF1501 family)
MTHDRRALFRALGAAGIAAWLPVGRTAFAAEHASPLPGGRRLVVVFLRGAVDGLSVVAPYTDPGYAASRPTIALARPGQPDGLLDLDGRFGLHPALQPLMPLWQSRRLAFIHASGSPDPTRSHFDAQDYMESATPGRKATPDGWLNRLLGALPGANTAPSSSGTRGVSVGPVLPRIWMGRQPVANIAAGDGAARPTALDRPLVAQAFDALYAGDDAISAAYRESRKARHEVLDAMNPESVSREMTAADNGAPLPNGFPIDAARLAVLMRRDPNVQVAFMAVGGWDTHAGQGNASGQLAVRLRPLGLGLAALAAQLGPVFEDTTVLVMSEFGRTVRQNGTGGTDHGHGSVMWVMGGGLEGGKVHGRWPGLDESALYEGRDLAVTTDFRRVIAGVCERQLRLPDERLATVLPDFSEGALNLSRS